jgi:hypothetical protein
VAQPFFRAGHWDFRHAPQAHGPCDMRLGAVNLSKTRAVLAKISKYLKWYIKSHSTVAVPMKSDDTVSTQKGDADHADREKPPPAVFHKLFRAQWLRDAKYGVQASYVSDVRAEFLHARSSSSSVTRRV